MQSITHDSRSIVGTALYMAPEQAGGRSRALTGAADIFSLGAIFYEMLTGRAPYEGLPLAALLAELTSARPVPSLRALVPAVNRSFENICLRCLEKDPAKRYRSAEELADDLDKACGGRAIKAPVSPGVRAWRWTRRHPRVTGALAGLALFTRGAGRRVARRPWPTSGASWTTTPSRRPRRRARRFTSCTSTRRASRSTRASPRSSRC